MDQTTGSNVVITGVGTSPQAVHSLLGSLAQSPDNKRVLEILDRVRYFPQEVIWTRDHQESRRVLEALLRAGASAYVGDGAHERFSVEIVLIGEQRIQVMKLVRKYANVDLASAKVMLQRLPFVVAGGVDRAAAADASREVIESGGLARITPATDSLRGRAETTAFSNLDPAPRPATCVVCGAVRSPRQRFCTSCGTNLSSVPV